MKRKGQCLLYKKKEQLQKEIRGVSNECYFWSVVLRIEAVLADCTLTMDHGSFNVSYSSKKVGYLGRIYGWCVVQAWG